jgi:peroxiredoxin
MLRPGERAPGFTLPDVEGRLFRLDGPPGRPLVLVFLRHSR